MPLLGTCKYTDILGVVQPDGPPPGGGVIMRITMSSEMISISLCVLSRSLGKELKPNATK